MNPLLILNDLHLGVQRVAGTTPASQLAVRQYLQDSFRTLVNQHHDKDLCIPGDLFDGFEVDMQSVLDCYMTLSDWLFESGRTLILGAGNHDIGKRNDRLSSFSLLGHLLLDRFPDTVTIVKDGLYSFGNIHVIPHCMNQDLFNIELEKALHMEPGYLLLHANVDNGFTEHSDHSLNVDGEWLTKLSKKHHLLFAHEHQHRHFSLEDTGRNPITVMGNQWPSSVSDCLAHGAAQKDGMKYAHLITDGTLASFATWHRDGDFEQMDWTDLQETEARFIRITGQAAATQAADVVSAIAKYRTKSKAFVVGNGVKIDGAVGMDELASVSFEKVTSFDVLGALLAELTPKEGEVVKELLA